jgi:hypothetical protein
MFQMHQRYLAVMATDPDVSFERLWGLRRITSFKPPGGTWWSPPTETENRGSDEVNRRSDESAQALHGQD